MIVAKKDFRDEEYFNPKEILEREGAKVTTASSSAGAARGMLGGAANVETTIDKVNPKDFDAVVFVGGAGATEYWQNPIAHKIAKETVSEGKLLTAICFGPVTLANAGVLRGKKATVFQSEGAQIQRDGAVYTKSRVEIDGKIITADGPFSAQLFGEAIVQALAAK